ncbi:MAG: MBOAT family O-acyltransferase [Acidimicrobiales bacterium]
MVFSSITFLFFFLPITLAVVWALPPRSRNTALLAFSLLFYAWGSGWFVLMLVATSAIDYRIVDRAHEARLGGDDATVKRALIASVVLNLGVLAYFKYAGFLADDVFGPLLGLGDAPSWLSDVVLPVGISFFTFQRLSYSIDVATGRDEPVARFRDYLLFIALFPQLIAGPIVRYGEIHAQLLDRTISLDGVSDGVVRFSFGLAKKVLVADTIGVVADAVFDPATGSLSTTEAIVGTVAYTLQLYFDFSGYSDMAIGLGLMLGFRFPENFDRPYTSESVTEFWRRWHMTLSHWFRDYVYIPLGGNRTGHTQRNLIIVFGLTGLWHGAAWTFVIWGAYHGVWLLVERRFGGRLLPGPGGRVVTLAIVMVGWIIFRAPTLDRAGEVLAALGRFDFSFDNDTIGAALDSRALLVMILASVVFVVPHREPGRRRLLEPDSRTIAAGRTLLMTLALPAALIVVSSQTFSPFLYFQF